MGNPNLAAEGVPYRFTSTNQPARRGRLPSKLKKFVKDNSISYVTFDKIIDRTPLIFAN